jgi:predicted secreted protein
MKIKTQSHVATVEEALEGSSQDMAASWKRLVDALEASSKEIDALSVADASQYVEQRRQFEHQSSSFVSAFGCR